MKRISVQLVVCMAIVCGLSALGTAAGVPAWEWNGTWFLEGTVGSQGIEIQLDVAGVRVTGQYGTDDGKEAGHVHGVADRSGYIVLLALDDAYNGRGRFSGQLAQGQLEGTWLAGGKTDRQPVKITAVWRDLWTGVWERTFTGADGREKLSIHAAATAEFWDVAGETAQFELLAFSGAHIGHVAGTAELDGNQAVYRDQQTGGVLRFAVEDGQLSVTTEKSWVYGGIGVDVDGRYRRDTEDLQRPNLWDLGVFPSRELDRQFLDLVGRVYYERFVSYFQLLEFREDRDGLGATVVDGHVRGLAGHLYGRIMYTGDGKFVAVISEDSGFVTYFSNHPQFIYDIPETFDDLRDIIAFG